jgi:hypothetical protein
MLRKIIIDHKHIGVLKAIERATRYNGEAWPRLALERLSSTLYQLQARAEAYFGSDPTKKNLPR